MTDMPLKAFFFTSVLALLSLSVVDTAQAQPADSSYFHRGAHLFIDGSTTEAKSVVMEGLQVTPNDPKLLALRKKLEREQKQQSQSGKNKQQQNKNKQSKGNQSQQDGNNEQSSESEKSGQQQEQNQQKEPSPQDQQKQQAGEKQQQSPQTARKVPYRNPEKMSEQQALRILQALGNQEQKLLRELKKAESRPRHVEKDW